MSSSTVSTQYTGAAHVLCNSRRDTVHSHAPRQRRRRRRRPPPLCVVGRARPASAPDLSGAAALITRLQQQKQKQKQQQS